MELLDNKQRKARKEHRCNFCGEIIHIGELYEWHKIVDNGEIYEWKGHTSCHQLVDKLNMADWCNDGVTGECFQSIVEEEYEALMRRKKSDVKIVSFAKKLEYVKNEFGIK